MKKCVYGLLLVIFLLSLSACSTLADGVGPNCNINIAPDAYEPNDKPEDATPLTSAAELTGTFKELDLPDYFTVTGQTGDVIMLEKKFGIGEPTLSVKDADGNALTVKQDPFQTATLPKDGAYLIQVGIKTTGNECPDDVEYDVSLTSRN
jgi:ABC-type Fe3+-hydroxamate transport system substrate-binding protein